MGIYQDRKKVSKIIANLIDLQLRTEDYDKKLSIWKDVRAWNRVYSHLTFQYYIMLLFLILVGVGMGIAAISYFIVNYGSLCPLC